MRNVPIVAPILSSVSSSPEDILDALRTVAVKDIEAVCQHLDHWVEAAVYLGWARADLEQGDPRGYSNCVTNAKRAVCRRIDEMVINTNLEQLSNRNYPEKIEALARVGHTCPEVVHELVIEPRNRHEHDYEPVKKATAKHAIEIADLFVRATGVSLPMERMSRPVLFGRRDWTSESGFNKEEGSYFRFYSLPTAPFLLVDIFAPETVVRIINYPRLEVLCSPLNNFSVEENIRLAEWCESKQPHKPCSWGSHKSALEPLVRAMHLL